MSVLWQSLTMRGATQRVKHQFYFFFQCYWIIIERLWSSIFTSSSSILSLKNRSLLNVFVLQQAMAMIIAITTTMTIPTIMGHNFFNGAACPASLDCKFVIPLILMPLMGSVKQKKLELIWCHFDLLLINLFCLD